MPTIDNSKWGYIRLLNQSTHTGARDASSGQVSVNPTSNISIAFSYDATSAGRGLQYSIHRAFYYFDTTAISASVASATINIEGVTNAGSGGIVVKSTAFSGDGSTNLAAGELGNVTFATAYSSEFTSWSTSGNNAITLNSTALSGMKNDDFFICAVLQHANDYSDVDSAPSALTEDFGIAFGTKAYLDYTLAGGSGPTGITKLNSVTAGDILSINGVTYSGITSFSGVS